MVIIGGRGQSAVEFMIVFGAMLFFFTIFFIVIQESIYENSREERNILANDIALSVKEEILLAHESSEGYMRSFHVPLNIYGLDYGINLSEGHVYLYSEKIGISYIVSDVSGNIVKGNNTIRKEGGTIYLNQ